MTLWFDNGDGGRVVVKSAALAEPEPDGFRKDLISHVRKSINQSISKRSARRVTGDAVAPGATASSAAGRKRRVEESDGNAAQVLATGGVLVSDRLRRQVEHLQSEVEREGEAARQVDAQLAARPNGRGSRTRRRRARGGQAEAARLRKTAHPAWRAFLAACELGLVEAQTAYDYATFALGEALPVDTADAEGRRAMHYACLRLPRRV